MWQFGNKHLPSVRHELLTNKVVGRLEIVYLSDLHLRGSSEERVSFLIQEIERIAPDIVLLGGDYVESRKGLTAFHRLLEFLQSHPCKTVGILGNHDRMLWKKAVSGAFESQNIPLIEENEQIFCLNEQRVAITTDPGRQNSPGEFNMLLVHKPVRWKYISPTFDAVFAGHLHGCQVVFWQNDQGLYPGRFFYPMNGMKYQRGSTYYFISKGLGDTLPVRYNCTTEVVHVTTSKFISA